MTLTNLSGLELSGIFYQQAVRPLLETHYPTLRHTACLVGAGSEILGFDDAMSRDHGWGPRLQLFLENQDYLAHHEAIDTLFSTHLPYEIAGFATHFTIPAPDEDEAPVAEFKTGGPINHAIEINTIRGFVHKQLHFDIEHSLEPADWLTFSEQHLRTLIEGAVYHDDLDFAATRTRFNYYPHDVWLYLLIAGWARIGQEEHLMGRAGFREDEIGSAIMGARLVRDIMRLCFLMERTYAPYPKWFGTAFKRLDSGPILEATLKDALAARSWQEREAHLVVAYEHLAQKHNDLRLGEPLPVKATQFFDRPFRVITFNGYGAQLRALLTDPAVLALAGKPPIGGIDQFSDSTDLLSYPGWRPGLKALYTTEA